MSSTSYDLITINNVAAPDVKKGTVTVLPNPKYNEYDVEDGGKVIDVISEGPIKGTVSYNGLLQSEIQALAAAINLVSTMTIYNPYSGAARTFTALINITAGDKIIHDDRANAWTFAFDFEEIGNA